MIKLIENATTIGISDKQTVTDSLEKGHAIHSIQMNFDGSPSELVVEIDGSLDGVNFQCLTEHIATADELAAGTSLFHIVSKPVPVVRANIKTLTGGVSPKVSVIYFKGTV
jgi:hypothetical protein